MTTLRERTLEMVGDALTRCLGYGEELDCYDFGLVMLMGTQGPFLGGVIHISLKGVLVGTTMGNTDVIPDVGALSSQQFIDGSVRGSLEAIRKRRAALLVEANGHQPPSG